MKYLSTKHTEKTKNERMKKLDLKLFSVIL